MPYTQLYLSPTLHVADTYLQYKYQITHAIQIMPGLRDVERTFRPAYAEFDAPSPPSAAHALLTKPFNTASIKGACCSEVQHGSYMLLRI